MDKLSPPMEDYLKAMYMIRERAGHVTTTAIATATSRAL
jgi:Mn-dependent DtxR family transcriptional regulator